MAKNKLPAGITTDFSISSFANTINPFSKMLGGTDPQYVPNGLIKLLKSMSNSPSWTTGKAAKAAHVASKVVGGGLTAAALFAALRLGAQYAELGKQNLAGRTAGDRLAEQYQNPVEPLIQTGVTKEAGLDPYASSLATLPLLSALFWAATAYKKADQFADQRYSQKLDKDIDSELKQINSLGLKAIRKARGVQQPIQKNAAARIPAVLSSAALLLAGAGVIVGYKTQRAYDQNYIKYKAFKKGLDEYSRAKKAQNQLATSPISSQTLASLDPQTTGKKAAPQLDDASVYKPVDIA